MLAVAAALGSILLLAPAGSGRPPGAAPPPQGRKLGSSLVESVREPAFGDLPAIRERGELRVLVSYGVVGFYLRQGHPRGLEVDAMSELEKRLGAKRPKGESPLRVVYVPTPFERLIPDLVAGLGDVAAGLLTVTEARSRIVDFSLPYVEDVEQVVVSRNDAPSVGAPRDLAGRRVHVPRGSSTVEGLRGLSGELAAQGLAPVEVVEVPGASYEDLLEMVAAGMFEHTVTDDFLANLWAKAHPSIRVDDGVTLRADGDLAWAVRKDSPELRAALDGLARRRSSRSNRDAAESIRRYTRDPKRLRNALAPAHTAQRKLMETALREAADRHGFDWLLLAALAFQESRLDPEARNPSGAVGLLQVLPATGEWLGYPDVHPIRENVLAGTAYLALLRHDHFEEPAIAMEDRIHFALAAYNAGPARVASLRRKARARGLDPDVWFGNVELEAYRDIGQETPRYVANIVRYYVAYRLAKEQGAGSDGR
jgi:membrane-bound lytic murein transglycosylase MltF